MNKQNSDHWLEELLSTPESYIEDDGFTDQVILRLPERSRRWRREFVKIFGVSVMALVFVLFSGDWLQTLMSLEGMSSIESAPPSALWMLLGGMVVAAWVPLTIAFEED